MGGKYEVKCWNGNEWVFDEYYNSFLKAFIRWFKLRKKYYCVELIARVKR